MTKQIICNVIMFLFNAVEIVVNILWVCYIAKTAKQVSAESLKKNMTYEEAYKYHQKAYISKYYILLLINVGFLAVGITTCLLDGLSDADNYIVVGVVTVLIVFVVSCVLLIALERWLGRRYGILMVSNRAHDMYYEALQSMRGMTCLCIIVSFLFAFNCAMSAYTIALLCA